MKITKNMQEKLEAAFKGIAYKVRYEKGTFKSGYCIIEEQKVVVINKFYPLESKVNALVEIMREINPLGEGLDPSMQKLIAQLTPSPPAP